MSDETTEGPTCYKCGNVPPGPLTTVGAEVDSY